MEDIYHPRQILFLSVDIIGSTSYKYIRQKSNTEGWLEFFESFFLEFHNFYFNEQLEERDPSLVEKLKLWKGLGDEILFYIEVKERKEVINVIKSFREAVINYKEEIREKKLSVKATAWIAEFPLNNKILRINGDNDFIGPQIDIGFRLGKYATERKFVISVELALLLTSRDNSEGKLHFFYDERKNLKNVKLPELYPIIWIEMYDKDIDELKILFPDEYSLHNIKEKNSSKLRKFCKKVIKNSEHMLNIPILINDEYYKKAPEDYYEKVKMIAKDKLLTEFENDKVYKEQGDDVKYEQIQDIIKNKDYLRRND